MKSTWLLLSFSLFGFTGASFGQKNKIYTLAFYNVENLYDTLNDPGVNDEEFLPEGKNNWTSARFHRKLSQLSRVIDSLGEGPSVLGMCEVENRAVLEALVETPILKDDGLGIVHASSPDKRGIDVALLYRKSDFVPEFQKSLPVTLDDDPQFATRDILLVKGKLAGRDVYIFVNHWPSRRGGEPESRPKRMAAARVARLSVDTILKNNPMAALVLMGDFNDTPTDVAIKETLKASGDIRSGGLFNTMAALQDKGDGSYSYKEHWDMIDQIIISPGLVTGESELRWKENSTAVYRPFWMHDKYAKHSGAPYRTYAGPKYLGGFSDHFPVFAVVEVVK